MHINRKQLMVLLLAVCALPMAAGDGASVVFHHDDGSNESVALEDLHKITFRDGNAVLQLEDGTDDKVMSLDGLHCFVFNDEISSVVRIDADAESVRAYISGGTLRISGYDADNPSHAALYNVSGALLMRFAALATDAIDVSGLPSGVYILKLGNRTFKLYK